MNSTPPRGTVGDSSRPKDKVRVGPVAVDCIDLLPAAQLVNDRSFSGAVHLCNAYTVACASGDRLLAEALDRSALNLADGMPVVWLARLLRAPAPSARVYGPDLMAASLDLGQTEQVRHFLFGSTPSVLNSLEGAIQARWPGAKIVGVEAPPFGELSDEELHRYSHHFEAVDAQVVWIGLGTPVQDLVADRLARISDRTFVCVGAAFDFLAGNKRQAPLWMQRSGLEWVFRLCSEPRRLWRRYLVGNVVFLFACIRSRPRLLRGGLDG